MTNLRLHAAALNVAAADPPDHATIKRWVITRA